MAEHGGCMCRDGFSELPEMRDNLISIIRFVNCSMYMLI